MDFSWIHDGITDEDPCITGPECINFLTNRRRLIEDIVLSFIFLYIIRKSVQRLDPIVVPPQHEVNKRPSAVRLLLLISMTFIFGVEMGFKFAGKSVIFALNPCHIQTLVQIYLLAAKPSKLTIALFRIQMNNLNGPVLAFMFPEVAFRTLPFEQATYWIQHALLYIIPVYMLRSGVYSIEDKKDYNWTKIGTMIMLLYHFAVLSPISFLTGINLSHQLCAAMSDPFRGQNYRICAVIHECLLCPILNKGTVYLFSRRSDSSNKTITTTIDKMPSFMKPNVNFAGINGNELSTQNLHYPYRQQNVLLTPSDSILKHRRHSMEYIYDAPQNIAAAVDAAESDYMATTTLMPDTKID